ncbi:MAG: VanZ family protein [Candidatus Cryptobacteroides sp.]
MKLLEHKILWRILSLIYLGLLCYLCFSTPESLPSINDWKFFIPADKVVHFCMFFPAPVLLFLSIGKRWEGTIKALPVVLLCLLVCTVLAGATELIQNFRPGRSMSFGDFVADVLGMILSCLLFLPSLRKVYGRSRTR